MAFVAVFLVGTFAFFWNLGRNPIANADEGVHALVTQEIRESGDWLTLHIRGEHYFRKPPLSFWVRAVTENVIGATEFADRLPSALAGLGAVMILAVWAWQLTRRPIAVLVSGAILALLPSTFTHTFRTGETDGILLFLLVLSAYLLWRSMRRPWLLVAAAVTIGLAFMTKSVAAGVVPIGFLAALALHRRWPYRWKHVLVGLGAFLVVTVPWHAYEFITQGRAFYDEYVGYHILQRVETKLHITPQRHGPFWYTIGIDQGMFPWAWLIIPALASVFRQWKRDDERAFGMTFLATWGLGTVILFSLAATKLPWYVAPSFPAFALLIGMFVSVPFIAHPRWLRWLTALFVIGYLVDACMEYRTGLSRFLTLAPLSPYIVATGAIVALVVILLIAYRRSADVGRKTLSIIAGIAVIHITLTSLVVFSRNLRMKDENPFRVFRNAIEARDPHATVYVFNIGYVTSPLSAVYWEGPNHERQVIPLRENMAELDRVATEQHGSFVVLEDSQAVTADVASHLNGIEQYGSLMLFQVQ